MRILILGGDADGNLGDRAILQAMCRELEAACPGVHLTVVSGQRARAERDYGAKALARGPLGLLSLCAAAAQADLLLCGGGGLFHDDDSLVKMPYWALRLALLRPFCSRIVGYSLGVGPLDAASSRLFARMAFACMERVTVRDPGAQRTAQPLVDGPVEVVPDPALLLSPAPPEEVEAWLRERRVPLDGTPLVGVAPRRFFPPRRRLVPHKIRWRVSRNLGGEGTRRLTTLYAEVLDRVVEDHAAYVLLLPTYAREHEGDIEVSRTILDQMKHRRGQVLVIEDPALYRGVAARLELMICGRMHASIFAAAAGTPVVTLAYNPKFHGFLELIGLSDRIVEIESLVRDGSTAELHRLIEEGLAGGGRRPEPVREAARLTRSFTASLVEAT